MGSGNTTYLATMKAIGAPAPPFLLNSNLYYGNSTDELVVADSMSGAIKTSIYIISKLDSIY